MIFALYMMGSELFQMEYDEFFNLTSEPTFATEELLLTASLNARWNVIGSQGNWANFNSAHAFWEDLQKVDWMYPQLMPPEPDVVDYPI